MASQTKIEGYLVDDRGVWTVRARFVTGGVGKKKLHSKSTGLKVSGHNKRKAEIEMNKILREWEKEAAKFVPSSNPLFKECVQIWLERKRLTLKENTLDSYKVIAKAHIIPQLGSKRIADLTRDDIRRYYEKLARNGITANTLKKHRVVIHGVLEDAVLDEIVAVNVSDHIKLPKIKKFEGTALSEQQVLDMLIKLEEQPEPIRAAVTLALAYGLRRSEICGLRWKDIDFQNNVLKVRNTVTEFAGTVYEAETTKTKASCRTLYLVEQTIPYLQNLRTAQREQGFYNGKVCANPDGRPVKPEYITRACMRFIKECGHDGVRLHDLRHTAATILAKRVPIKQVQAYLGHEDIQTTLSIYTHILDEDSIATSNAMGDFLAKAEPTEIQNDEICSGNCSGLSTKIIRFDQISDERISQA